MSENRSKPGSAPQGRQQFGGKRSFQKKKVCRFCSDKNMKADYKDFRVLKQFVSERGKITPRRITGNCAKHQREVATAIKRARILSFLPFTTAVS
ncbi:MAG: 30S ribosomal protein S18 [Deltaproteobacteria bacterium]|nr:30S ribosomal protein S18 [Deltaproteobacteria bacterium]